MVPGARAAAPEGVLDLFDLGPLHGVELADGCLRIGACTTFAELLASEELHRHVPLLWEATGDIGAVQIRERGTIGGNVVTASPVGDMLPGLLALEARVMVSSVTTTRVIPYEQFLCGYRTVDLATDELLVAIEIPVPEDGTVQHWRKVGTRAAQAVTKVSIAATARLDGRKVAMARLAFGAVADRPVRLHAVEQTVEGAVADERLADVVDLEVRRALGPFTDHRSTGDYRRDVAGRLAAAFFLAL
jgi:CO/xanthine dehydrogenase FAD-binding subunit